MTLYSQAVDSVRTEIVKRRAELLRIATEARAFNELAQRAAIIAWEPEDSPWQPVVELLASRLIIGRQSDGYPEMGFDVETRDVLRAALAAGMDKHCLYNDCSGFESFPDSSLWRSDRDAWDTEMMYRDKTQCVFDL